MESTNLNIRTDKDLKEQADRVFTELGISMSAAINIFLKATVRNNGIPFPLELDKPNRKTAKAILEGRRLAKKKSTKSYGTMEEFKESLGL